MAVDKWNDVLQRNGFSGLDLSCQDSEVAENQQLSLMISTLDDHRESQALGDVVILEPASLSAEQEAISTRLIENVSQAGQLAKRIPWSSDLSSCNGRHCIVLMELDSPFLDSLKEDDFLFLKNLVDMAGSILWVTKGDNPKMDLMLGASRTIRNEMNGLKFRILQLVDEQELDADALAKQIWDVATSHGPDVEYKFQDGAVNIARLTEEKDTNEIIASQSRTGTAQPEMTAIGKSHAQLKLEIGVPGMLDTLFFAEDTDAAEQLGVEDVEINVKATGLKYVPDSSFLYFD
jgi:hypothetical protein